MTITLKTPLIGTLAMAVLIVLGISARSAEARVMEKITLQLKWYHQFQFAGYYAAEQQGFFAAEGLSVTIIEGSPTRPPLQTILRRQADFGVSDSDVLLARMEGQPVVACAAVFQHSPYIFLTRHDSNIRGPGDLVDKRIMMSGDQGAAQLRAMMGREGLRLNQTTILPHTWDLDDLITGKADAITAYATVEPSQLRARGVRPWVIRPADYGVDFYGDILFTRSETVENREPVVEAMTRACMRGWTYAMEHPEEIISLIEEMPGVRERGITRTNLTFEAKEMRAMIQPGVAEMGNMNPARWQQMADDYAAAGVVKGGAVPDWMEGFLFQPLAKRERDYRAVAIALACFGTLGLLSAAWCVLLRRKVEQRTREVRQGEAKLHAILDNSGNLLGLLSADGRLLDVNRTALEFAGTTHDAVLGKPFWSTEWWAHSTDLQQEVKNALTAIDAGGDLVRMETTHPGPGTAGVRTLDFTLRAVRRPDGSVDCIVAEGIEITGRKAAAAALELSRADLSALVEHTRGLIWSIDAEGRLIKSNRQFREAFFRRTGRNAETGGSVFECFDGAARSRWEAFCRRALEGENFSSVYAIGAGASLTNWEVSLHPILRDGVITGVTVFEFDVTERTRTADALVRSAELMSLILDSAPDAVVGVDADGRIGQWNVQATAIFGVSWQHAFGSEIRKLLPGLDEALAMEGAATRFKVDAHRADGTVFPAELSISRLPADQRLTLNIFVRDITERLRLEDKLRQSQKMEAIGQLAGGVAHDFNNLLTVIQGNACMMQTDESAEASRHAAEEIITATERASGLTRQLLAFSRQQPMKSQCIEAKQAVSSVSRMLGRIIGEDIRLETSLCEEPALVKADRGMLEQVLLNLAVNARDAMRCGGVLRVAVEPVTLGDDSPDLPDGRDAGEFIRIDITDTGTGINPEHLPHIFEPFFTTKEVGKGTGLGLATVFGIVQQHHGWVTVRSAPGKGTTFSVWLPEVSGTAELENTQQRTILPARKTGNEGTILLVEDEEMVRLIAKQILTRYGYRVLEASSGRQALEVWKNEGAAIDLLLTDIVMPEGVSGRDLALQLQSDKPGLRVIYTSGYTADVFNGQDVLPPNSSFLGKPYRPDELIREIREALEEDLLSA